MSQGSRKPSRVALTGKMRGSGTSRRDFIQAASCAAVVASPIGANLLGKTAANAGVRANPGSRRSDFKAMVCIFLYGGNDANNLLVPTDGRYAGYAARRGNLALPKSSLLPIKALNTTNGYGLHPATGKLQKLFNERKLAVLANVGTLKQPTGRNAYLAGNAAVPTGLLSHSEQQLQWQVADSYGNGWGGRCVKAVKQSINRTNHSAMMVSLAGDNAFQGTANEHLLHVTPGGAVSRNISGFAPDVIQNAGYARLGRKYSAPMQLVSNSSSGAAEQIESSLALTRDDGHFAPWSWDVSFNRDTLGEQLKMIARLIQARTSLGQNRQIFFASLGGFDLHAAQIAGNDPTAGAHANLLNELSEGMYAFQNAMEQIGMADQIVTFTASEFGRSLQSNGEGSEHGWGSHQLIMGGQGCVNGQSIYGRFPSLNQNGPDDAGNGAVIPTTSVDQYAATLARWFGVSGSQLGSVVPGVSNFPNSDLEFMRAAPPQKTGYFSL